MSRRSGRLIVFALFVAAASVRAQVSDVPVVVPPLGGVGQAAAGVTTAAPAPGVGLALPLPAVQTLPAATVLTPGPALVPAASRAEQPVSAAPTRGSAAQAAGAQPSALAEQARPPQRLPAAQEGARTSAVAVTPRAQLEAVGAKSAELGKSLAAPGARQEPEKAGVVGQTLFDAGGAGRKASDAQIDEVQARAPPSAAQPSPTPFAFLSSLSRALDDPAAARDVAQKPQVFVNATDRLLRLLKDDSLVAQAKTEFARGDVTAIGRRQAAAKARLSEAAKAWLKANGLPERAVLTHGSTVRGLLGILFSGGMKASNPHPGFSGESAGVWAGSLDTGAGYASVGAGRGRPAVLVALKAGTARTQTQSDGSLKGEPTIDDIAAVLIAEPNGDGVVVFQQEKLAALAASAAGLRRSAQRGDEKALGVWMKLDETLSPRPRGQD